MSGISSADLMNLKSALDEAAIVAITDEHGTITFVNKKFCQISKYSSSELISKTHRVINSGHHPPEFFQDLWKTISSGQVWEGEIRNRAKDGSFYWVHTTIVPMMGEGGRPKSYVSVRFEITDRVLATEALERSNQELQNFASIAAHDLQEPLRKVRSFADRVQTKAGPLLPLDLNDYLTRMHRSVERMQTLIDDLLSYSRVTTHAKPLEPVALNKVVADVLSDLEPRIEATGATLAVQSLPVVLGDATQLRQVMQNLVSNALKFKHPESSPKISIWSKDNDSHTATIHVRDNGIGFDEKYLDRIFTIFQRLHGRSEFEGTGIGLAIVRKIIERHGGHITAHSRTGEGAEFIFKIPKARLI